jgi:hypothetical protein
MTAQDVTVVCDVRCVNDARYRVQVAGELFTERRWRWGSDYYLEEIIAIRAEPGVYPIQYEMVPGDAGAVQVSNWRVVEGPARVDEQGLVEILSASN